MIEGTVLSVMFWIWIILCAGFAIFLSWQVIKDEKFSGTDITFPIYEHWNLIISSDSAVTLEALVSRQKNLFGGMGMIMALIWTFVWLFFKNVPKMTL